MSEQNDHAQRTDGWRRDRAGKITASRFADVLAKGAKGQPLQARTTYLYQLANERLSGEPLAEKSAAALSWGKDVEDYARQAYELETGEFVETADFILHPEHDFIGCSPDGLVQADGGLEMKCPFVEINHLETLHKGMPDKHIGQVQGCMFVTGRKWWDFVSYDPRQAAPYRLYIQRIERDEAFIAKLEAELLKFEMEVEALVTTIENMRTRSTKPRQRSAISRSASAE